MTFLIILVTLSVKRIGHQHLQSGANISNKSPIQSVSNIRHQHRCNRFYLVGYFAKMKIWFTTQDLEFLGWGIIFFMYPIKFTAATIDSQAVVTRPSLERMTLSHQNVWILGNIYTVFQFRVLSNNHTKIKIYNAKSIFCQNDFRHFLLPHSIFYLNNLI